jgi:hypothetical protein
MPDTRGMRGEIVEAVFEMHALVRWRGLSTDAPGRHSRAGRIGRGTNPPPQFGQTLPSLVSTQSAQNVHS